MPMRSGVPRYRLIEAVLRDQIFSGELHEGDRVPTEEQLVRSWKVSRPTVRRALGVLQRERLIVRTARRGTFVNRIAPELPNPKTRLTLDALGAPQRWKIVLRRHGKAAARGEAQAALGVAHGEEIFYFIRSYHHQDGRAVCAAKIYLRSDAGALLTRRDLVSPQYAEILSRKLGMRLATVSGHVEALLADARTGAILGTRPGSALLSLRRNAYTASGEPVEHVHMLFRSDLCQIDFTQPWA